MTEAEGDRKARKTTAAQADPVIPDKLYFRIGEVAKLLGIATYVLRFWESEFPQLHPNKGGTGQRLYRRRDVEMALRIKQLLYTERYTIPGARDLLRVELKAQQPKLPLAPAAAEAKPETLQQMRSELKELASLLARPLPGARRLAEQGEQVPQRSGLHIAPARQSTVEAAAEPAAAEAVVTPRRDDAN